MQYPQEESYLFKCRKLEQEKAVNCAETRMSKLLWTIESRKSPTATSAFASNVIKLSAASMLFEYLLYCFHSFNLYLFSSYERQMHINTVSDIRLKY